MAKTKTFLTLTDNLPTILRKNIFHEISPKSFSQGFLLIFKFSENFPKTHREFSGKNRSRVLLKTFPEFYNFPKFPETILLNMRYQFCLAAESIGQDGAILPDDQPIKLRESRAG